MANKFSIENVSSFRGFDVVNGEIHVTDNEWSEYLTEAYGYVNVCGTEYASGDILEAQDPVAFRCGKNDYESEIQSELEEQLSCEDDSGIEFINDFDEEESE